MLNSLRRHNCSALCFLVGRYIAGLLFFLLVGGLEQAQAGITLVQSAQNFAASGSTSITVPISTTAGNLLVVYAMNGGNNTATVTISDSASQVWTQTTSGYASSASTNRSAMFYKANSAAVTSVTVTWTASANNIGAIVYEISGADINSPADGSVNSSLSGSGITSLTSGSLTTTNANDILIYGGRTQANETTWTAGTGYTIPANGSNTRQGMQFKIVSSTQSGVTTSMSWNTATVGAAGIFAAFKAASGVGTAATVTATGGTPQSATINMAFSLPLQATVKDSLNNPVNGVVVTFTAPPSGASGTFAGGMNTATTNASGVATSAVFTANGTVGGPYNVVASAMGATSANFALTNTAGKVAATSGSGQSATINTAFSAPLVATVTDASSNPVSGVVVTFTAPGAGASGTFAGGMNTATTNASGVATSAVFTANSVAGTYNVVASAANASSANFAMTNTPGPAAKVAVASGSGQSAAINTAFAAPLVVTVTDASNNPVNGVVVTFTAPPSGASGTFAGGMNTATTNASGVATSATFTANGTAGGPYTVVASATGATSANFSLTNNLQTYALSVSISSDRRYYVNGLQGASISGGVFIFTSLAAQLTNFNPTGITSVSYWLDNTAMTGSPMHTASAAPYDFAGQTNTPAAGLANAWGSTTVPDGTHTITQSVSLAGGGNEVDTATFTVQNQLSTTITSGRYEYVFPDQNIYVYDLSTFQLVKHVSMPQLTAIRGVAVVPSTHMLYVSFGGAGGSTGTTGSLLKYDLLTDTVVWTQNYSHGVDTFSITPDGSTIYMPDGASSSDGLWYIVNATTGAETGSINSGGVGPHNTIVSLDGAKVFMGPINSSFLAEANTSTNTLALTMGPLHQGVRPFSINGKHTLAFTTANTPSGLGFQVSDTTTGNVLYTVPVPGFSIPAGFSFNTPQHGISLSPNEKEIYLIDTANAYVHVFDVSGLPSTAPVDVADIPLTTNFSSFESPCAPNFNCVQESWVRHTLDGRYVLVDDSGDVIDTTTRQVVNTIPQLFNTRKGNLEIDWSNGLPVATTTHFGLGYVTGSITATAGTPQSAAINTAFATQLQVTVKDASNNPMNGVLVTFTANAAANGATGTFTGGNTATTNAQGIATANTLTANGTAGAYTVTATATGAGSVNFALTNLAGAPASIAASAGTPQSAVVNTPFSIQLQVTVKDASNNPVSGAVVTFAAPTSGPSGTFAGGMNTATTNTQGVATAAIFTANGTSGGPYTVTASVAGVANPANFSLTNLASPPFAVVQAAQNYSASSNTSITVPVSTTAGNLLVVYAMNGGSNTATVTISDSASQAWTQTTSGYVSSATTNRSAMFYKANSAAVTSVTVTWTASANNIGAIVYEIKGADINSPADGSVNSSLSGSGITSLTSGSLTTTNANDILIYGGRTQADETTWTAGTGYTIPANGSNTRQGMQYEFVSSTQSGATTSMSWNAGTIGAAGIFAAFKETSSIGTAATVTATAGSGQSTTISTAFGTALKATVTDGLGNPVPNTQVTFTAPTSGASGTFPGSVTSVTVNTNSSGVATAPTFTANATAGGPYTVTAKAGAVGPANFSLTNTPGAATNITPTAGTPQSATINTAFSTALKAKVTDSGGNGVPTTPVTFTAPGSGASGTFPGSVTSVTVNTDATGVATAPTFTADGTAGGPYTVSAMAGAIGPANFNLTNTAVPPANIAATAGSGQNTIVGTAFATALKAKATDSGGNPVSGVAVTFTAPTSGASGTFPGPVTSATVSTDATGVATAPTFTANGAAGGPYTVTAMAGAIGPANFSLTNNPGSAANIAATAGSGQSAVIGTAFGTALKATVTDSFGNLVPGVAVTFSAPTSGASGMFPGSVTSVTVNTDATGVATAPTFTANANAGGPYNVVASATGATSVNFSLTNLATIPFKVVQSAQNFSASANTSITVPVSTTAGNLLVVYAMNGGSNTATVTISDSASQVWTQTTSGYVSSATTNRSAMFYKANSAAVTSVTVTWTASANNIGAIVYEISGADINSPADGSVNSSLSGSGITSLTSGSLTTTNANDILIYGGRTQADETTWTAGTGYTIPPNGSNTRQGMQYEFVSSTQSGVTTSISWNTGTVGAAGIFAAFTAPGPSLTNLNPTSGTVGTTVIITGTNFGMSQGNSTVTFNGISAGTASSWSPTSIAATVPAGATTGNVVVTVGGLVSNGVNFTVTPVGGLITISPRVIDLTFTRTQQFTATAAVTWLVDGVAGGSAASGTITSIGLYTPPSSVGTHTVTAQGSSQSANATVYVTNYPGTYMRDVDTFRTGQNLSETTLTPANVNTTQFGKLFSYSIDGVSDASPLYVANVNIPGQGFHNVVYIATGHDSVYAFDADGLNPQPLWHVSFINPAAGINTITPSQASELSMAEIGITGTPVIDPATGTLYVVAATAETTNGTTNFVHRIHALDITTGAEKFGGPVVIQASVSGAGDGGSGGQVPFMPLRENQRAALLLTNGIVYVAWGAHSDVAPYHGWVMGYNASTLQQVMVYNTTPNGSAGGIWQSGDGLTSDSTGRVYFVTGNGTFDPTLDVNGFPTQKDFGDSIVAINPNGTVSDYFTPHDQSTMASSDLDLGSGGAMLLPDQPGPHTHEVLAAGKNGTIYVVDRDNMGHFNSTNDNQIVQSLVTVFPGNTFQTGNFKAPVYFNGSVYWSATADNIEALSLTNGLLSSTPTSQTASTFGYPGCTLQISANGSGNGILWAIERFSVASQGAGSTAPGILHAFDATNLGKELYNSNQAAGGSDGLNDGAAKWAAPLIANGKVFVASTSRLTVFGLRP